MAEKLFTEFPPVSTAQWEEVITKDLKGADYEKKLVWKTYDGFSVRPYYRAEDLQELAYAGKMPGEFPFVKGTKQNNKWYISEGVCCCDSDFAAANKKALTILTKGVEAIKFYIDNKRTIEVADFATLLNGIALDRVPVYFCDNCIKNTEILANFLKYVDTLGIDKDAVRASFDYSPVGFLTRSGRFCEENAFEALDRKSTRLNSSHLN